ncbi:ADP-dependent glucokinase/phosphofructokinase [Actinomyces sp. B33]|uniref:ADP-dependent glucokinase/phosphofructokinase n=1 Tax=Actinomyces sp. B33 TaxID=2942131 RepID=UPI0023428837|nr:ADP-dependent glucokinase/phosphofructokinase [Actinomyces sp. B33]MDC4232464.1 ADP-dependent glucokinase/phosphofructokinase [Actinomyces sp. B33]
MEEGRIVLGLGGTVDHEVVWDPSKVQELAERMAVTMDEIEDDPTPFAEDARSAFVYLLQMMHRGRGGECHVRDIRSLMDLDREFESRTTLGGTCVRAALAMDRIGIATTVHLVSINDDVRRLLPPGVARICSADDDSFEPHVIVQFPADEEVAVEGGVVRSGRPNRVILVNDPPNELMRLSPDLAPAVARAGAVMISGFNTMKSSALLRERLAELRRLLGGVGAGTPIVYEDAGFHDEGMRAVVLETIPDLVCVHSLNEDEAAAYLGRGFDPGSGAQVARLMEDLRERLRARAVLLHTSHYAAVIGEDAERIAHAADSGCRMASTRFAYGDDFTRDEFERTRSAPLDSIGARLASDSDIRRRGIRIAPSYDIDAPRPTTIGLGDSFIGGFMAAFAPTA